MHEHLIFYDHECPLCHRAVRHVLEIDTKKRFIFAPLKGETASKILAGPLTSYTKANSLILFESYQSTERRIWIRSGAIFRIYWLVGDGWKLIGWLCFMPSWLGDRLYRFFAEHRHQFKLQPTKELGPKERFLP